MRSYRSVLYVPASNARAMDKARGLPCDAVILDLEDAVSPQAKPDARAALRAALTLGFGHRSVLVRVNALSTPWGREDLQLANTLPVDGIVVPKLNTADELDTLAQIAPHVALWGMVETAQGVLNLPAIAAHPKLFGLIMGTNDLSKELRVHPGPERAELQLALQSAVLAARAQRRVVLDGVCNAIHDTDSLKREADQGRALGFDGKTIIHPAQIAITNAAFTPTAEDVDLARRQIAAFEAAQAVGQGVVVVDGQIVEQLHVDAARDTLARLAALQTETS